MEDYAKPKPKTYEGLAGLMELINELSGQSTANAVRGDKVAVIYALGAIVDGKSAVSPFGGSATMGDETMVEAIDQAREDEEVKAVVLRVDSPGGSALASDLMWRALVRLKQEKPLIVSMGEVAGSGGYYIAMPADTIVADESTITGSIGVVGGKLAFGDTFKKYGVTHSVVEFGDNAGTLSLLEPFDDSEEKSMRRMLEEIYEIFTRKAAEGRGMGQDALKELAGGRIYSGERAKELGLVDELGTLEDAIELAQDAAAKRFDDVGRRLEAGPHQPAGAGEPVRGPAGRRLPRLHPDAATGRGPGGGSVRGRGVARPAAGRRRQAGRDGDAGPGAGAGRDALRAVDPVVLDNAKRPGPSHGSGAFFVCPWQHASRVSAALRSGATPCGGHAGTRAATNDYAIAARSWSIHRAVSSRGSPPPSYSMTSQPR